MAEIFLARLPGVGIEGFEKLVVLKRILPQHALDPELLRMFIDEARLSATLTHPHVTEVYDVGSDGDAPFFAMEYVHGANVRELLRAQYRQTGDASAALPLAHAIAIVAGAAAGLHYAHERTGPGGEPLAIVHRDVSPSNVLVSYDGAVKVSDFGIAKWAYQRTRTQEGTLKGKFAYMSPEQCRARPVDRRSDVFALGSILYELTTGTPPFAGASDLDILNQIATGRAAPPAWPDGGASYPPALSAIVMRALAPDPDDRYPSMQALQVALESYARDAGIALSTMALASFVQDLFADELAAWRAAQGEGKSLAEHLAARPAVAPLRDGQERTATDAFATSTVSRLERRNRVRRFAAVAGFVVVCAVAGGLATKAWTHRGAATGPRPAAGGGGETSPASSPTVEASLPPTTLPAPGANAIVPLPTTASAATKTKAKLRQGGRQARATPAGETKAQPATADSRLGAWDPDSPVPP